jgi:predicted porin
MKKTLIAMAAVAVAGVASAQATITGTVSAGWQMTTNKNAADGSATASAGGWGMKDGKIAFTATEDLGAGMSITASAKLKNISHDTAVASDTSSLTLTGGFGTVAMTSGYEACDGLSQQGLGVRFDEVKASATQGFFCAASVNDALKYTSPELVPGMKVAVLVSDNAANVAGRVKAVTTYVDYASGPLAVGFNTTSYEAAVYGQKDNKTRFTASYDLGVAKIGFGNQKGYVTAGDKDNRSVYGVSIPMGAMTAAIGYASIDTTTSGTVSKTTGTSINVKYALSKRTSLSYDGLNVATDIAGNPTSFNRLVLAHSF